MKKTIISVISILLVSVMMAVMLSGCYSTTGYYFYAKGVNNATVDFQEDGENKRVEITATVTCGAYGSESFKGTSGSWTKNKSSVTVTLYNTDTAKSGSSCGSVQATLKATNGYIGDNGSNASLTVNGIALGSVAISK